MPNISVSTTAAMMAIGELDKQGLAIPMKLNSDVPQLPPDISDLSDSSLMLLFSELTAYTNFLSAQLALAIIDERTNEAAKSDIENVALLRAHSGKSSKDTITMLKVQVAAEEDVSAAESKYLTSYNYRKLVEVLVNNAERDTILVSRELTRRTSGYSAKTRGDRMFT